MAPAVSAWKPKVFASACASSPTRRAATDARHARQAVAQAVAQASYCARAGDELRPVQGQAGKQAQALIACSAIATSRNRAALQLPRQQERRQGEHQHGEQRVSQVRGPRSHQAEAARARRRDGGSPARLRHVRPFERGAPGRPAQATCDRGRQAAASIVHGTRRAGLPPIRA
jgi:hypothetical protein